MNIAAVVQLICSHYVGETSCRRRHRRSPTVLAIRLHLPNGQKKQTACEKQRRYCVF
jgi:hypothetical protein